MSWPCRAHQRVATRESRSTGMTRCTWRRHKAGRSRRGRGGSRSSIRSRPPPPLLMAQPPFMATRCWHKEGSVVIRWGGGGAANEQRRRGERRIKRLLPVLLSCAHRLASDLAEPLEHPVGGLEMTRTPARKANQVSFFFL